MLRPSIRRRGREPVKLALIATLLGVLATAQAGEQDIRNSIALGALAFADNCKKCHRIDGYGEAKLYPSLHDAKLLANKPLLIRTILHGRTRPKAGQSGADEPLMPALDFLSNREVSAIIAFISNSWGDDVLVVSEQEVQAARSSRQRVKAR